MQGDRLAGTRAVAQASRRDQFCEQLGAMLHLVVAAELRIFILQCVVTMRTRCHDLLRLMAGKRLDIGLRKLLVKKLIADSTRRIARYSFPSRPALRNLLGFLQ
jgi:hypothetical protein